ncbi:AraC family transcriptional regulator [Paenibacillus donghaensis]|uniref:AraC family transcriptional regulator n=1 Tax=Paenibacillus donghaensis TaxID=414771 RepID=UPI0012FDE01E|nr:AraC family transcriptional regulator [Paenibacillus donghaensis]
MNNRQLICQALDHIEDQLRSTLPVQALAETTGYSLYHFIRLFQAVTGMSPGEYIARRRITEAAHDIMRQKQRSLQDISLDYDFNNYETFSRAFRRILHTTPTQVRRNRMEGLLPLLHPLHEQDLHYFAVTKEISPQLAELGEVVIQGPIVTILRNSSIFSQAWHQLFNQVSSISGRMQPERYYQVGYWPDDYELSGAKFMCGCELVQPLSAPHDPNVRAGMESFFQPQSHNGIFPLQVIPPARYLKFYHRGLSKDISHTYKYFYEIWLPKSEFRLSLPFEFEYYGEQYLGPDNERSVSEIYIPLELL